MSIGPKPLSLGRYVFTGTWTLIGSNGQSIATLSPQALTFGNAIDNAPVNFLGTGAMTLAGTLAVSGSVSLSNVLAVGGNTQLNAALTVVGGTTLNGAVVLASALPIAQGGTAATTAAVARTNLGLGPYLRQASLGSGVVTVQAGGSPSGGADGDIFLIY